MNNYNGLSIGAWILHYLAFLPIIIVYFVFELFKAIFTELHRAVVPIFILVFLGENLIIPRITELPNVLYLKTILDREEWSAFLIEVFGPRTLNTGFERVLLTIVMIIFIIAIYVLPAAFMSFFVWFSDFDFNERFNWDDREIEFSNIFEQLKYNSRRRFELDKRKYYLNRGVRTALNIACPVVVVVLWNLFIGALAG